MMPDVRARRRRPSTATRVRREDVEGKAEAKGVAAVDQRPGPQVYFEELQLPLLLLASLKWLPGRPFSLICRLYQRHAIVWLITELLPLHSTVIVTSIYCLTFDFVAEMWARVLASQS